MPKFDKKSPEKPQSPRQNPNLSQVFLKEQWPLKLVVDSIKKLNVNAVIEVGPGGGVLTKELLEAGITVCALEKDRRFVEFLNTEQKFQAYIENRFLEVVQGDATEFDISSHIEQKKSSKPLNFALVGNIPYAISTQLLMWGLREIDHLGCILFLTQDEFAKRLCSPKGTKDYGSLSVYAQLRAEVSYIKKVPAGCFRPVPKVDSALVLLVPSKVKCSSNQLDQCEKIVRAAFQQRRKKLHNSLASFVEKKEATMSPIDLNLRPEVLAPEDFLKLSGWIFS